MKHIFITGISTDVGKTIASAIVVEALQADYFKPIQAGELDFCDTQKVKSLVSNQQSIFHANSYALQTPMSPDAAASIEGVTIDITNIKTPKTKNHLVTEGAGGLLVPLNDTQTILDIIPKKAIVIVVSRHYLGSINHTLLTVNLLKEKGFQVALIFSGSAHENTECTIKKFTNTPVIGRIDEEPYFDKNVIKEYAAEFKSQLEQL